MLQVWFPFNGTMEDWGFDISAASNSQFTDQVSDIGYFAKYLTLTDIQKLYAKGHIPIATAS